MLQFPGNMMLKQWSPATIPPSQMFQSSLIQSQSEEELVAIEEASYEEKLSGIRNINRNLIVIGKPCGVKDKEEDDNEADDEDVDNAEESEGEEFEQETA